MNIPIEFCIFELLSYQIILQAINLGLNLPKKVISSQKGEKVNITIECCIIELVLVPNFSLSWQFLYFGAKFSQKVYLQY